MNEKFPDLRLTAERGAAAVRDQKRAAAVLACFLSMGLLGAGAQAADSSGFDGDAASRTQVLVADAAPDTPWAAEADSSVQGEQSPGSGIQHISDWNLRDWSVAGEKRFRYLAGVSVRTGPDFFGASGSRSYGLHPTLAVEWGWLRLSSGGGSGLIGSGLDGRRDRSAGLEGIVRKTDRFNMGLSLNIDRGRRVATTDRLRLMPDVPTTVRLRLRTRYAFTNRWTTGVAFSQDILGRGGGLEVDARVGYDYPLSVATLLTASLSASLGNGPYMRSQFGVPASAAAADLAPFRARAGLYQTNIGLDVTHSISRHWVAYGGVRYVRLHGDARRSPLVNRTGGVAASIGVAWRN